MSERRPTFMELVSKTRARAKARGGGEVLGELARATRQAFSSAETLRFLVRAAGGQEPRREDVAFRAATSSDGELYARDIGTDSAATFRRRLTETTGCYVVERDGRLLHASWVTTSRAWTNELRSFVTPPHGDAYIYESFTRAETRGQGIYPFALGSMCARVGVQGAGRVWVAAEASNNASIKAITKAGFSVAFTISYRRRRGRLEVDPARGPQAVEGEKMVPATSRPLRPPSR